MTQLPKEQRKLHNQELNNSHYSTNIIKEIKPRKR